MNGKNIIAAMLVSLVSVALAVGITFIVARGNSLDLTIQTPDPTPTVSVPVSNTLAIGDPVDTSVTSTLLPTKNCTFPIDAWVQYPGAWKIDTYRVGGKIYTKKEIVDILRDNSSDVRGRLLTQIFVVVLNQQNGADATKISSAFSQAIDWLETFPPGSVPSDGDLQKAHSITNTLAGYNEGVLGPPACLYELSAATAVPLLQNRTQVTPTGSRTATATPYRIYPTETNRPREDGRRPTRVIQQTSLPTAAPPSATPMPDIPTAVPTIPQSTDPPAASPEPPDPPSPEPPSPEPPSPEPPEVVFSRSIFRPPQKTPTPSVISFDSWFLALIN